MKLKISICPSVRANLLCSFQCETPCSIVSYVFVNFGVFASKSLGSKPCHNVLQWCLPWLLLEFLQQHLVQSYFNEVYKIGNGNGKTYQDMSQCSTMMSPLVSPRISTATSCPTSTSSQAIITRSAPRLHISLTSSMPTGVSAPVIACPQLKISFFWRFESSEWLSIIMLYLSKV